MKNISFASRWLSIKVGLALMVALLFLAGIGSLSTAAAQPPRPGDTGKPTPVATAIPGDTVQEDDQNMEVTPTHRNAENPSAQGTASTLGLGAYSYSSRVYWGFKNGSWKLTLYDSRITVNSRVFASVSEVDANGYRIVGAAKYTVHNIAPRNGAVTIWITIDWGSPLRTVADYLVIQP
ncbi:MAG: hypothetical protein JST60_22830 [Chloroflexi bacterium SZAS-1]|nr:hypothetical protein [Chloroflexi bacterium SZAS-1]